MTASKFISRLKTTVSIACVAHVLLGTFGGPVLIALESPDHHVAAPDAENKPETKDTKPETKVGAPQDPAASFADDLNSLLKHNGQRHVLLGDHNHCDMRPMAKLSDPRVLKVLAENGVSDVFIEVSDWKQRKLDRAVKDSSYMYQPSNSTCGDQIGEEQGRLITRLVRNADKAGIKVHGADVSNGIVTSLLFSNFLATVIEARMLEAVGLGKVGNAWMRGFGWEPFIAHRADDRKTSRFIAAKTRAGGRSLTLYGLGHLEADGPNSMRANLPSHVAIAFNDPSRGTVSEEPEYKGGPKRLVPDHVVDVAQGHITSYGTYKAKSSISPARFDR